VAFFATFICALCARKYHDRFATFTHHYSRTRSRLSETPLMRARAATKKLYSRRSFNWQAASKHVPIKCCNN
jgi:hypothetical protein